LSADDFDFGVADEGELADAFDAEDQPDDQAAGLRVAVRRGK
jgi:hypothetical protein